MKTKSLVLALMLLSVSYGCDSNKKSDKKVESKQMDCVAEESIQCAPEITMNSKNEANIEECALQDISPIDEIKTSAEKINKKKIIKDGEIFVRTKDIFESKKNVDETVKKFNAYYDNEDFENNDNEITYTLTIRIPANNFELFIASIENGKNEITNKNIKARDVTDEFIDLGTRLTNKKEYLKRYKELLAKASTIKDILAIQENIRTLQEEIESSEGRLKYITDQVDYSSLSLTLTKIKAHKNRPPQTETFSEKIKDSLASGWASIVDFFLWIIAIWPLIIVIAVSTFLIRWLIRKRRIKKSK